MLAVLAAFVALVGAGAVVTAARDDGDTGPPLRLDERAGTYRGVGIASSEAAVRRVFGEPGGGDGFVPLGERFADVGGPLSVPNPPGAEHERPVLLRYENVAFLLARDRVYAFIVTDRRARTSRGVALGDSLAEARRAHGRLVCYEAPGGERLLGGIETYRVCRARVRPRRFLSFGRDPIRSMTLYDRSPVGG